MKNLQEISSSLVMNPIDSARYVNVNKIADSIEKATIILEKLRRGGTFGINYDAIMTWERILYSLRMRWNNAIIEIQTKGHYTFE
jgi:hypothetical protein